MRGWPPPAAKERLAVVEERLSKLGVEIEAIRKQTEQEIANDEKRIQESLEDGTAADRGLGRAGDRSGRRSGAARAEEVRGAAGGDRARQGVRLSAEGDRLLIQQLRRES